jgi:hypothetical protein
VKKAILGFLGIALLVGLVVGQEGTARSSAIVASADRLVELQRTDPDWQGTWYWYVGSTYNATNLTGVTALGLLEAFRDVKDPAYLDSAKEAADFIMTHLGIGATGAQYNVRTTAPDIVFLHKLSDVTGDEAFKVRAVNEWNNIKSYYPTAAALDTIFRSLPRRSSWDIAFYCEAAYLSGDAAWANTAAEILANTVDTFYYGLDNDFYALNVSAAIRALIGCGYYAQYPEKINELFSWLIAMTDTDLGVGSYIQDTAYAVLAFNTVGGGARAYSNDLARWLTSKIRANGGWLEGGDEYPEINGEALRALGATIGSNVTLDGFEPGAYKSSSWKRVSGEMRARPFLEGIEE